MKNFRRGVLAKVGGVLASRGSMDATAGGRIAGWALGRGPVRVEAWLGNRRLISCEPSIARADVAAAYPGIAGSSACGFAFDLPYQEIGEEFLGELHIEARPTKPWLPSTALATLHLAGPATTRSLASPPDSGIRGLFPRQAIDAVTLHQPEDCTELLTAAGQRRFVDRLLWIMATPDINSVPIAADYARYLIATYAHCRFVERHFPQTNRTAAPAQPTSIASQI